MQEKELKMSFSNWKYSLSLADLIIKELYSSEFLNVRKEKIQQTYEPP